MRADLYTAPFLFLLGALFTYGGWTMDRLEIRQIHPASIPGLVPMLLGVALAIAAIVLFVQARGRMAAAPRNPDGSDTATPGSGRDLMKAAVLCCIYALGLVGTVPFVVATALFVAAFVLAFELEPGRGRAHLFKTAAIAVALGVIVAAALGILFRYAFLVRLP